MVKITQNLVSPDRYERKCPYALKPQFVVIHNTANDASAADEVAYMRRNDSEVGFHYAVDDREAVLGIPENRNAWHAGDGNGDGNRRGLSIEICHSKSGGAKFDAAERNAAELAASLLRKYGLGIERLKKHQDYNSKYCPHRTLDRGWARFVAMVQTQLAAVTPATPTKPAAKPSAPATPAVVYCVRTSGRWLPEVKGLADYAGLPGQPVTDVAIRVTGGSVKYRVHIKGGRWLPYVTGYNTADSANGYAGNGQTIDAIEIRFTPAKGATSRKAKYRVSPGKGGYWPWQTNADKSKGMDGYAGAFGVSFDRLQITLE